MGDNTAMPEMSQEKYVISSEREKLFEEVKRELTFSAEVYSLGDRFEGLPSALAPIVMLDTTQVPGCHYSVGNPFLPIIHDLEENGASVGKKQRVKVSPETTILFEASTGNGWVAFSNVAQRLGYEHIVVMPDGLPESRYIHPEGRQVKVQRTPAKEYAVGMKKAQDALIGKNRLRLARKEKLYVSPNHAIDGANRTIQAMSELGRQLTNNLGELDQPLRVVISMGNGASLCGLGEYVKDHTVGAKVVATESFAYGGGYEQFAKLKGLLGYQDLFGIESDNSVLMGKFSAFGTNARIGIELPLQTRAMISNLIDDYILFTDDKVLSAYKTLHPGKDFVDNAQYLPNYSQLPHVLFEAYGNSTLANIAVASRFTNRNETVVAMAYDSRENY